MKLKQTIFKSEIIINRGGYDIKLIRTVLVNNTFDRKTQVFQTPIIQ